MSAVVTGTTAPLADAARAPSSFARRVATYAPLSLVPLAAAVASSAYFTRHFGSNDYGRHVLTYTLGAASISVLTQWLQQGIQRFLPSMRNGREAQALQRAVSAGIMLCLLALAVLAVAAYGILLRTGASAWAGFLLAGAAYTAAGIIYVPAGVVLQAHLRPVLYGAVHSLWAITGVLGAIALVHWVADRPEMILAGAAAAFVLLAPALWIAGGLPLGARSLVDRAGTAGVLARLWDFGHPMIGWFLAVKVLEISDRLLLQWLRDSADVGVFAANAQLMTGVSTLAAAPVLVIAHPALMRSWSERDAAATARWLSRIIEVFTVLAAVAVGWAAVLHQDIADLVLGPEFRGGAFVLPVVLASSLLWQVGMYVHKPLEFGGRTRSMFRYALIAAATNVVLNVITIPWAGFALCPYVSLVAALLYVVLCRRAGRSTLDAPLAWSRMGRDLSILAAAFVPASILWAHGGMMSALAALLGVAASAFGLTRAWRALR